MRKDIVNSAITLYKSESLSLQQSANALGISTDDMKDLLRSSGFVPNESDDEYPERTRERLQN
jgi:predicted HTH domain antitoxin